MLRLATATILLICLGTGARAQSIEEKAEVCGACHGENGIPLEKDIPIIWGQHAGYAYLQLRDFNKGVRHSPRMSPIAEALSKDDMTALAEYFEKKQWPKLPQPAAGGTDAATANSGQCFDRLHRMSSRSVSGRRLDPAHLRSEP